MDISPLFIVPVVTGILTNTLVSHVYSLDRLSLWPLLTSIVVVIGAFYGMLKLFDKATSTGNAD